MNKCFKCGAEFEGDVCPECGAQSQQDVDVVSVAQPQGLLVKILNYAPIALYALWAVLLWAFYATGITAAPFDISMYDYYDFTSDSLMIGFYVLAGIACAYIAGVVFAHIKGDRKWILIANLCAIVIQITVFIFALAVGGKLGKDGLETGVMIALVAAFAAIFAVFQGCVTFLYFRFVLAVEISLLNWLRNLEDSIQQYQIAKFQELQSRGKGRWGKQSEEGEKVSKLPEMAKNAIFISAGVLLVVIPIILFLVITQSF